MIDLRQLRYFVHIAEIGNLNKAAQFLNVAQSALSRQMAKLEEDFGLRFFDRHGRGLTLTEAGRALQAEANKLLAHAREVELTMRGHGAGSGEVTIGLPAIFSQVLCAPIMRAVQADAPQVKVKFLESYSGTLPQLLRARSVDIAILYGPQPEPDFDLAWIMSENLCAIGEREHLPQSPTVRLADLSGRHLIIPHRPHPICTMLDSMGAKPGRVTEAATLSEVRYLIQNEDGIFIHQRLAKDSLSGRNLVALPIEQPALKLEAYIASLKSSSINRHVEITKMAALDVAAAALGDRVPHIIG